MDFLALLLMFAPFAALWWWFQSRKRKNSTPVPDATNEIAVKPQRDTSQWTPADHRWHELQQETIKHAKDGNWGLYANTVLHKADHLRKEGKHRDAFNTYSQALYLDINGPENSGMGAPFDVATAFVAPMVWKRFLECAKAAKISDEKLRDAFVKAAERRRLQNMPIEPAQAWEQIAIEVAKRDSLSK